MSRSEDSGKISRAQPQGPCAPGGTGALSPTAMTLQQAARILAAVGARHATVENLRHDIEAGAPANADGTINLVHYAAWLAKEMAARGD